MTELRGLTGARGVAAWLIVLYHIRLSLAAPPTVVAILAKGYLAVDFFFLLSGFVIWNAYAARLREGRWAAVPTFLLRRIARIWPLHLVMLAFGVAIAVLLAVTGRPPDPRFDFADLPAHILLVQNWRGYGALDWNDPAWSISCELFAYLLFPLVAMTIDWRRMRSVTIAAVIGVLIAAMAGIMAARGLKGLGDFIPQFGLLRCSVEFLCGTGIAAIWARHREAPRKPLAVAAIVAATAFALYLSGTVIEMAIIPVAFAALLLILAFTANAPANPLARRALHYLGEISFATYLSHSLLWKAYKLAFVGTTGPQTWPTILAFLAIVLIASIALYHLVERPAQKWINGLPKTPVTPGSTRGPAVSSAAKRDPGSSPG